jgi:hypothetical protein
MFAAELRRLQLGRTAGSSFQFSLFRANEKNKIASGRHQTIPSLAVRSCHCKVKNRQTNCRHFHGGSV